MTLESARPMSEYPSRLARLLNGVRDGKPLTVKMKLERNLLSDYNWQ